MTLTDVVIELEDQAVELGFRSLDEALEQGYQVDTRGLTEGAVRLVKGADD